MFCTLSGAIEFHLVPACLEVLPACIVRSWDTIKNLLPGSIIGLKYSYLLCKLIFHEGCWSAGQSACFIDLTQDILFSSLYDTFSKIKDGWLVLAGEIFTKGLSSSPLPHPCFWTLFSVATVSRQLLLMQD